MSKAIFMEKILTSIINNMPEYNAGFYHQPSLRAASYSKLRSNILYRIRSLSAAFIAMFFYNSVLLKLILLKVDKILPLNSFYLIILSTQESNIFQIKTGRIQHIVI